MQSIRKQWATAIRTNKFVCPFEALESILKGKAYRLHFDSAQRLINLVNDGASPDAIAAFVETY